MTARRTLLAVGALAVAALATPALAETPRCDGAAARAVHTAHEAVEVVPVGGRTVGAAAHTAEGAACALPR